MTAPEVLAELQAAGVTVTVLAEGKLSLVPTPPPDLLAMARTYKPALLIILANGEPVDSCPACDGGLFVRASIMSGGPGPWHCQQCDPLPDTVWLDACCIPARGPPS
jgi:hypothetical protein